MTLPPHETITSPANPRVRAAAALRDAAARRDAGLTLVDGMRELARAAAAGIEVVDAFVAAERIAAGDTELAAALVPLAAGGTRVSVLAPRAFDRVAFGSRNEGLVGVVRFAARPLATTSFPTGRPILLVEGVEKPGNLGAILRTVDAAGLAGVVACDTRTDPANPAAVRASLGTVFTVPLAVASTADTIAWCTAHARRVVAATPDGRLLWHEARLAGPVAILLGSEALGISPAWRAAATAGTIRLDSVRLPMRGAADSLNVAATAAVLAYEAVRQEATEP
ncbi:MAG: TrmH family RNA methyltransferase [Planctomycetaceae bacterium]